MSSGISRRAPRRERGRPRWRGTLAGRSRRRGRRPAGPRTGPGGVGRGPPTCGRSPTDGADTRLTPAGASTWGCSSVVVLEGLGRDGDRLGLRLPGGLGDGLDRRLVDRLGRQLVGRRSGAAGSGSKADRLGLEATRLRLAHRTGSGSDHGLGLRLERRRLRRRRRRAPFALSPPALALQPRGLALGGAAGAIGRAPVALLASEQRRHVSSPPCSASQSSSSTAAARESSLVRVSPDFAAIAVVKRSS